MQTKLIISIVVIVVVLSGFFLIREESDENSADTKNQADKDQVTETLVTESKFDKAPNFTLEDIDGNTVSLSDFAGKTVVVNSWATWCPFCVDEIPDFVSLQKEFGDEIVVIAIDRQESLEKSKAFTDDLGATDGMLYLLDPKDSFYKSIGGFSMPETIFVDEDQNIIIHKRGPMELPEMIAKTNQTLGK
jgi:cytochrome c biogenesis protein CcmG, thiol:disulfide interchange protein DsbE